MTDERLDKLLAKAPETFRVPPEPPIDQMWLAIDAELSTTPSRWHMQRQTTRWNIVGIAAAAALLLGVGVGRWSATSVAPLPALAVADSATPNARTVSYVTAPMQRATSNYLGETEALLSDLQSQSANDEYAKQATVLLVTTRVLLDSPEIANTRLHDLLEDLELILAQVATLRGQDSGRRKADELQIIRTALTERDVVPRLRTAVVTLASIED